MIHAVIGWQVTWPLRRDQEILVWSPDLARACCPAALPVAKFCSVPKKRRSKHRKPLRLPFALPKSHRVPRPSRLSAILQQRQLADGIPSALPILFVILVVRYYSSNWTQQTADKRAALSSLALYLAVISPA